MKLFAVKPKLQSIEDDMQLSQSQINNENHGVGKFRMKPNQFTKEKINLFNILAQDSPYRIPGTKIAIIQQYGINMDEVYNETQTKELRTNVQLCIDILKRVSKDNTKTEELKYDSIEITEDEVQILSHRQQLQILNELCNLRKEINILIKYREQWVEVITNDVLQKSKMSMMSQVNSSKVNQKQSINKYVNMNDINLTKDDLSNNNQAKNMNRKQTNIFNDEDEQLARKINDNNLNTQQVEAQISGLKMQNTEQLTKSRPPLEDYSDQLLKRPLSPNRRNEQDNNNNNDGKQNDQLVINYDQQQQNQQKKRHSKYRSIAEFLAQYDSEYSQNKMKPKQYGKQQRDFIQENIDNQQYYKRRSRLDDLQPDSYNQPDLQKRNYQYDQLSELMMRIHMQKLAYEAKTGNVQSYKELILAQQQFIDMLQNTCQKDEYDQAVRQSYDDLAASKSHEPDMPRQFSPVHDIEDDYVEPPPQKFIQKTEYKVLLPHFTEEMFTLITQSHKKRQKQLLKQQKQNQQNANPNQIIIDKFNKDYENQFSYLCDQILQEIIKQEMEKQVDILATHIQMNTEQQ